MTQESGKRIVSRGEYALRKWVALSLTGSHFLCLVGIVLLLLSAIFSSYLDDPLNAACWKSGKTCQTFFYFDMAMAGCIFLVPVLSCTAYALYWGKQKSWEMVHAIHPVDNANIADLPLVDSLVRASIEPLQAQERVLLRAATEGEETQAEQLLRATTGTQEKQP